VASHDDRPDDQQLARPSIGSGWLLVDGDPITDIAVLRKVAAVYVRGHLGPA